MWSEYSWIWWCGVFASFFMAWGIGANDVANAFGTSVGAKALTLRQAVIVASFCEFGGAVLLGAGVTDTIKSGIADVTSYTYKPELLMYGMLCALAAGGMWLALATFLELPVSTTHTIVGAIVGFSMVGAGADSVIWSKAPQPGSPFPTGFVSIVLAWFITPLIAAVVAAGLFQFTKIVVLYAKNPFRRSLMLFPFYTFITIWVVTYFVIQKGVNSWMKNKTYYGATADSVECPPGGDTGKAPKKTKDGDWSLTGCAIPDGTNAWISAVTAAVVTIICLISLKWVIKLVERDMANLNAQDEARAARLAAKDAGLKAPVEGDDKAAGSPADSDGGDVEAAHTEPATASRTPAMLTDMRKSRVWGAVTQGLNVNIHECTETDAKIREMHDSAEVFDRKSELSFKYLQVCTACANSFAHGANDVANAIGPLATIYSIWSCACTTSKANVPIWMFCIGGGGLVVGLATYGYNIMRALGVKVTKITNSRGYCAELTAAIVVIVSSRYGFPVSTTQVITGAIAGIGVLEMVTAKIKKQEHAAGRMNWLILLKFFGGWVATLIIAGLTSAAFMAQGIYAPNRNDVDNRADYISALNTTSVQAAKLLNETSDEQFKKCALGIYASARTNLIDLPIAQSTFQNASWCLGNATLAGKLTNAFMPIMPDYVSASY